VQLAVTTVACALLFVPTLATINLASFMIGFGLSSLYPLMMMMPYQLFGEMRATTVISYSIASAQLGMILLPLLFGIIYQNVSFIYFPVSLIFLALMMAIAVVLIYKQKHEK
jgi:MFS family permease